MEISENELLILSYYRESELAGALIMGRLARETDDDELRVHLTRHCAEEAQHAWLWTETILRVGGTPQPVTETYQSRYYAAIGHPTSLLDVLALTQVFERRVVRHFRAHLEWPGTHPIVRETLQRMIDDEAGHLSWVKRRLDRHAQERGAAAVTEALRRYETLDGNIYSEMLTFRDRAVELHATPREDATASVADELRRVVAKATSYPRDRIRPDTLLRDLGVDSLDLVVLVMAIEEAFEVELEPSDLERVRTFADLTCAVSALREEGLGVRDSGLGIGD